MTKLQRIYWRKRAVKILPPSPWLNSRCEEKALRNCDIPIFPSLGPKGHFLFISALWQCTCMLYDEKIYFLSKNEPT